MKRVEFDVLMADNYQVILDLCKTKGVDYAPGEDRLSNFKENGAALGLTPEQVWGVYASKHYNAITTYIKYGQVESEPIEGRVHDLILYLFLFLGLIEEKS